jgi:hypothetical protein
MGMLQPGGEADLPLESLRAERDRELGMEHFEGNRSIVPQVVREEHGGHATSSQLALESVSTGQAFFQLLVEVCHDGRFVRGVACSGPLG